MVRQHIVIGCVKKRQTCKGGKHININVVAFELSFVQFFKSFAVSTFLFFLSQSCELYQFCLPFVQSCKMRSIYLLLFFVVVFVHLNITFLTLFELSPKQLSSFVPSLSSSRRYHHPKLTLVCFFVIMRIFSFTN